MKQVISNNMVAHVWAQQNQENARSNNGQYFFEGKTIYSYGSHFPVAHFLTPNTVVYNSDSYSITTSRHQALARYAANHIENRIFVDTETLKIVVQDHKFSKYDRDRITNRAMDNAKHACKSALKRRKIELKETDYDQAIHALQTAIEVIELFKVKPPKKLYNLIEQIRNNRESLSSRFETEIKRKKAKQAKKLKAMQVIYDIALEEWRNFETNRVPGYYNGLKRNTAMRIEDGTIKTSEHATFPIDHAKKAFPLVKACKDNQREFYTNGKTIVLGPFRIDKIDKLGNVTAGCHFVQWSEIERIADQLGLI